MAKKTKQPDAVTIRYELHELPTAQHKAGLAGLLLQINSMEERREHDKGLPAPPKAVCEATYAEVSFTAATTQALFDDLYEATIEEALVASKWPGATLKGTREVEIRDKQTKKLKKEKRFVYDVVQPSGPFLARYTDDGKEVWHKLWRDMLWNVPRGRPTTRGPYNARSEGKSVQDGVDAWSNLTEFDASRSKGSTYTVEVAGAIMLGAQAVSAERVGFEDRADHAILLHFWKLSASIFVPEVIASADSVIRGDLQWARTFSGFLIAIPSITNLSEYVTRHKHSLHFLEGRKRAYYPEAAVVALPDEAAAQLIGRISPLTRRHQASVDGTEYFHYEKAGNNTKLRAHGRFDLDRSLVRELEGIRRQYSNPLFRHCRLQASTYREIWFSRFDKTLSEREAELFICPANSDLLNQQSNAVQTAVAFAEDCGRRFRQVRERLRLAREIQMEEESPEAVDDAVFEIVRRYVHKRTLKRMGKKEDASRDEWKPRNAAGQRHESQKYREERAKLCEQAFLEFRSRQGEDFSRRFAEEMGPFGGRGMLQRYQLVASALLRERTAQPREIGETRLRNREDVRILTLLAVSAHSRNVTETSESDQPAGNGEGE